MASAVPELAALRVAGASLIRFPLIRDARGSLTFGEVGSHLPFAPQRFFTLTAIQPGASRGDHAHRELHQLIVCLRGSCIVTIDDAAAREAVPLAGPAMGLHLEPMVWSTLHDFSDDAAVLVLASDIYRESDYIRNYETYLEEKRDR